VGGIARLHISLELFDGVPYAAALVGHPEIAVHRYEPVKVFPAEQTRIALIDRLVDIFEEPAAQSEQLVVDVDDIAAVDGVQQRGDKPAPSLRGEEPACLEFRHLHRVVPPRLRDNIEGLAVADRDGSESEHELIPVEKVRAGVAGFVAGDFQDFGHSSHSRGLQLDVSPAQPTT
jgi:hypothetical protein